MKFDKSKVRLTRKEYFGKKTWVAEVQHQDGRYIDAWPMWTPATKDLRCIGSFREVKKALGLRKIIEKQRMTDGYNQYLFEREV